MRRAAGAESHVKQGIEVTFECQYCGGTVLALPEEFTDDSIAQCNDCGAEIGRWGDIKAVARQKAIDDLKNRD